MKRVLVPFLLVLLALPGCGGQTKTVTVASTASAGAPTTTDETDNAPDASATTTTSTTPSDDPNDALDQVQVGQTGTDDGIKFKVVSFERVYSVATDEFSDGPIKPTANEKLYLAKVRWTNGTGESADIFCGGNSAKLYDSASRAFDPDDDAETDIAGNGICGDDLQPGFRRTDSLLFRTPKTAEPSVLTLFNGDDPNDGVDPDTAVGVIVKKP